MPTCDTDLKTPRRAYFIDHNTSSLQQSNRSHHQLLPLSLPSTRNSIVAPVFHLILRLLKPQANEAIQFNKTELTTHTIDQLHISAGVIIMIEKYLVIALRRDLFARKIALIKRLSSHFRLLNITKSYKYLHTSIRRILCDHYLKVNNDKKRLKAWKVYFLSVTQFTYLPIFDGKGKRARSFLLAYRAERWQTSLRSPH